MEKYVTNWKFEVFILLNFLLVVLSLSFIQNLFKRTFLDLQTNILFFLYCDPHHKCQH